MISGQLRARKFMHSHGDCFQWIHGHPTPPIEVKLLPRTVDEINVFID